MLLPSSHIMVVPAHMPLLTFSWPLGIFPPSSSSTPFSQRVSLEPPRCTPQGLRADTQDPTIQARCRNKRNSRGSWAANGGVTDDETYMDSETDGGISECDHEVESIGQSHNYGESTLFLPVETLYSVRSKYVYHTLCGSDLLTSPFSALVPRRPIYDSCMTI